MDRPDSFELRRIKVGWGSSGGRQGQGDGRGQQHEVGFCGQLVEECMDRLDSFEVRRRR